MRTITAATWATAAMLLLTACSASDDTATATAAESIAVETTPTATPEANATVKQWASKVAPLRADVDEAQGAWDDATCSALAVDSGAVDCLAMQMTNGLVAQLVATTLGGLTTESSPMYFGEPPAEISQLVEDTVIAAETAGNDGQAVACPGEDCVGTGITFERSWDKLREALVAWDPYL